MKYAVAGGFRTPNQPLTYAVARVEEVSSAHTVLITWYRQTAAGDINSFTNKDLLRSIEKGRHVEVEDESIKRDNIDRQTILLTGVLLNANGRFSKQKFKREDTGPSTSTVGQLTELVEAGVLKTTHEVEVEAAIQDVVEEGEYETPQVDEGAEETKATEALEGTEVALYPK